MTDPSTTTAPTTTPATVVDSYFSMWNEPDVDRRWEHITAAFTDDAHYIDPLFDATGPGALNEMVSAAQSQFPGHRFKRSTVVDSHHSLVRFAWDLVAPGGDVVAVGFDVGALAGDGRLQKVAGFLGELAPAMS